MKIGEIIGLVVLGAATIGIVLYALAGRTGAIYSVATGEGTGRKEVQLSQKELDERLLDIERQAEAAGDESIATQRVNELAREVRFNLPRTVGVWLGAFLTLAIMSFLWKDNPAYRTAEHLFVGVSAAYIMVVSFWDSFIEQCVQELYPRWVKFNLDPSLKIDSVPRELDRESWLAGIIPYGDAIDSPLTASTLQLMDLWYWVPIILGIMLLARLAPKGGWISRWPLAFIIGAFAGVRMIGFLQADFIEQIKLAINPLWIWVYREDPETGAIALSSWETFRQTLDNIILLGGTLCVLIYFFFSLEHRGVVGKLARIGVLVLMITFGAAFGFTVMGRVALLVGRFEFLIDDWLYWTPVETTLTLPTLAGG